MKLKTLFMLAILVFCFSSTNALAENQDSNTEKAESFNLVGYVILGFALIGWTFFLFLLGNAIVQVVRKSKSPYVPINPVKCK